MLGLILGRRAGLAWEELTLCLLRVVVEDLDSDFLGTGPLGDGIALDGRSPGVSEPEGRREEVDCGSIVGVLVRDLS